jgi:para-aminobenzoate synthetase/4-amino-4-deoxychorismate lyase
MPRPRRIKAIARGDTYQATLYLPCAPLSANPSPLFVALSAAQRAGTAPTDLGRFVICSASPELFFGATGSVSSRVDEGTARGLTASRIGRNRRLPSRRTAPRRHDRDMIQRLCRVARRQRSCAGLFAVELPDAVTDDPTVTALTDAPLSDVLAAAFPAPQSPARPKRTMELRELEVGRAALYRAIVCRPGAV